MDISVRKYQLIEKVMKFSERELDQLEAILESEAELSKSLDIALQQVKEGKVKDHSQVKKKYEKWL